MCAGMAMPSGKVSDHLWRSGLHFPLGKAAATEGPSWIRRCSGKWEVAGAIREEPVLPVLRADSLKAVFPGRSQSCGNQPHTHSASPRVSRLSSGKQTVRDRGHWASSKAMLELVVKGWICLTVTEKSRQLCGRAFARLPCVIK